jgi:hypothetical protein
MRLVMSSPADEFIAQVMEDCPPEEIEDFSREEQAEVDRIMKEASSARL